MNDVLEVPLFPLPGVVLFPGVTYPFYVFEPRYRAMLEDVLDGAGLLGVPQLLAGFEATTTGFPPFVRTFGIGTVEHYETHDDGTSHILVAGRAKVALIEELPEVRVVPDEVACYRRARVQVIQESTPTSDLEAGIRSLLLDALAENLSYQIPKDARDMLSHIARDADHDVVSVTHVYCTVLATRPEVRQLLFEGRDVVERASSLLEYLRKSAIDPKPHGPDDGAPTDDEESA